MLNDLLDRIIDEIQREWGVSGLDSTTMYGEFAIEVTRRTITAMAQKIEDKSRDVYGVVLVEHKEAADWLRSN